MMADPGGNAEISDEQDLDDDTLWRLLTWVGLALVAVGAVILAAQTERGSYRLASLLEADAVVALEPIAPPRSGQSSDKRGLPSGMADADFIVERDRLRARIDAVERKLEVTGAVPASNAPAKSASSTTSPAFVDPPMPSTHRVGESFEAMASPSATGSVVTKTEFGIDVGGDPSIDGLRSLWASVQSQHAALLKGLRPVMAVRAKDPSKDVELRLVIGPLTDAAAATRLCGSLVAAGQICRPTVFEGQRLALR